MDDYNDQYYIDRMPASPSKVNCDKDLRGEYNQLVFAQGSEQH